MSNTEPTFQISTRPVGRPNRVEFIIAVLNPGEQTGLTRELIWNSNPATNASSTIAVDQTIATCMASYSLGRRSIPMVERFTTTSPSL